MPSSASISARRSRTSSRTARACCACSGRAGASPPSTSSPLRCCAKPGAGPALIVSPLLALMRNQIAAAEKLGIRAHTINSTNRDGWDEVRQLLETDAVDLLLISPERLNNPQFRNTMLPLFAERVGLLVIDEAHCISDWGHDFRPDYRRIQDMLAQLPAGVAVLCTTATANDRVVADVAEQLAARPRRRAAAPTAARSGASRCAWRSSSCPRQADRLAWLATHLPQLPGSGIVYTLTKRDADTVAEWLNGHGVPAEAYTGEVDTERARRRRGAAAAQRAQGRRGHERARHGLRQARPRLRRALPGARLGDLLLPAGRPRGPRDRARRRRAAARPRGPPDPGLLHRAGVPAEGPRRPRARGARRRRRDHQRADGRGQPRQGPDRGDAEGARRRGRGHAQRARGGCACRAPTGPTTATATRTSPRCAGASRRRWRRSAPTAAA